MQRRRCFDQEFRHVADFLRAEGDPVVKGFWAAAASRSDRSSLYALSDLRSCGSRLEVVQRMLGDKSAAMTLDPYADLFDGDLDAVATAMNAAAVAAASKRQPG